jgi:hypothetical protein
MNKMVGGKQCTVLWHVDNLKMSHMDANVVNDLIDQIDSKYGKERLITMLRGKVHDYLGMTIDYSESGKVKISIFDEQNCPYLGKLGHIAHQLTRS